MSAAAQARRSKSPNVANLFRAVAGLVFVVSSPEGIL